MEVPPPPRGRGSYKQSMERTKRTMIAQIPDKYRSIIKRPMNRHHRTINGQEPGKTKVERMRNWQNVLRTYLYRSCDGQNWYLTLISGDSNTGRSTNISLSSSWLKISISPLSKMPNKVNSRSAGKCKGNACSRSVCVWIKVIWYYRRCNKLKKVLTHDMQKG